MRLDPGIAVPFDDDEAGLTWRGHGRAFQAHVYIGPRAGEGLKRDVGSILNSIQVR